MSSVEAENEELRREIAAMKQRLKAQVGSRKEMKLVKLKMQQRRLMAERELLLQSVKDVNPERYAADQVASKTASLVSAILDRRAQPKRLLHAKRLRGVPGHEAWDLERDDRTVLFTDLINGGRPSATTSAEEPEAGRSRRESGVYGFDGSEVGSEGGSRRDSGLYGFSADPGDSGLMADFSRALPAREHEPVMEEDENEFGFAPEDLEDLEDMDVMVFTTGGMFKNTMHDQLAQSSHFARDELQNLYRRFKDSCPSGEVDLQSFTTIFAEMHNKYVTDVQEYAGLVFAAFDTDSSGTISFDEYITFLSVSARGTSEEKLAMIFAIHDLDGNGTLSNDETAELAKTIIRLSMAQDEAPPFSEADLADLLQTSLDKDQDGEVTQAEFIGVCMSNPTIKFMVDLSLGAPGEDGGIEGDSDYEYSSDEEGEAVHAFKAGPARQKTLKKAVLAKTGGAAQTKATTMTKKSKHDQVKKQRQDREDRDAKRLEEQLRARKEAERLEQEQAEAARKAKEEAERKAKEEAKRKAREEAEKKAREEAERKAKEEAEQKAREEEARLAREAAERKAKEEAERKAREEAERKAREEAERKAREEAERKAKAEAERRAREEAERKAREAAQQKKLQDGLIRKAKGDQDVLGFHRSVGAGQTRESRLQAIARSEQEMLSEVMQGSDENNDDAILLAMKASNPAAYAEAVQAMEEDKLAKIAQVRAKANAAREELKNSPDLESELNEAQILEEARSKGLVFLPDADFNLELVRMQIDEGEIKRDRLGRRFYIDDDTNQRVFCQTDVIEGARRRLAEQREKARLRLQTTGKLVVREDEVSERLAEVAKRKEDVAKRASRARQSAKKHKERSMGKKR